MEAFLKGVDEVAPTTEVLNGARDYIKKKLKLENPAQLAGLLSDDLLDLPEAVPVRGLVRRAVSMATQEAAVKRRKKELAETPTPLHAASAHGMESVGVQSVIDLLGGSQTLDVQRKSLVAAAKDVNVHDKLAGADMTKMPWHLVPTAEVFKVMELDMVEAKACTPPKTPFTYVDLTSKEILPLWIPQEAVGAKSDTQQGLDPAMAVGNLDQLSSALRRAMQNPRAFRNFQQWATAFWRYAMVAVAIGQVKWAFVFAHFNVIAKMFEEEKTIAFLYDDLCRRQWAKRAQAGDPELDLAAEVVKINKQVLESAKTRLGMVRPAQQAGSPVTPTPEALAAKAQAAVEAISQRADKAAASMKAQQDLMQAKMMAMGQKGAGKGAAKHTGGSGDSGGKKMSPSKQKRTDQWLAKLKARKEAAGLPWRK